MKVYYLFIILLIPLLVKGNDYYQTLGVQKSATQKEIKKQFKTLSLKYHPDKNPSEKIRDKYMEISNAYDVLSDNERRRDYDNQMNQGGKSFNSHSQNQFKNRLTINSTTNFKGGGSTLSKDICTEIVEGIHDSTILIHLSTRTVGLFRSIRAS